MGDASDLIKQFCAQLCHPIASIARASMPSAKKKSKSTGKQSSLAGAGMFPMLTKTSVAIGLFCLVPGAFWERCPESDKDKKYKCTVMESLSACTRLAAAGRAPASSARRWARMARSAWSLVQPRAMSSSSATPHHSLACSSLNWLVLA